jgi:archaellum component FlaF (FlaF/FlaG flagellin family)
MRILIPLNEISIIVKEWNVEYPVGIIEDTSRQMIEAFLHNLKGKDFKEN